MIRNGKSFNNVSKPAGRVLGVLISLVCLAGCVAGANHGILRGDNEITEAFKSYQVLPEHQYFITGPNARPYVIMGIHKDYTFQSKLWKAVDPTESQMKTWINSRMYSRLGNSPSGCQMLGPNGEQVGILYSRWRNIRFSIGENNQLNVVTPDFSIAADKD